MANWSPQGDSRNWTACPLISERPNNVRKVSTPVLWSMKNIPRRPLYTAPKINYAWPLVPISHPFIFMWAAIAAISSGKRRSGLSPHKRRLFWSSEFSRCAQSSALPFCTVEKGETYHLETRFAFKYVWSWKNTCCFPHGLRSVHCCFPVRKSRKLSQVPVFSKGADIGWLQQMEATGYKFYDADGTEKNCLQLLKDRGMNSIRLRVWVNPSSDRINGHCSKGRNRSHGSTGTATGHARDDQFHYSDSWADPVNKTNPPPGPTTVLHNYWMTYITTRLMCYSRSNARGYAGMGADREWDTKRYVVARRAHQPIQPAGSIAE